MPGVDCEKTRCLRWNGHGFDSDDELHEPLELMRLVAVAGWCLFAMGDRAQGKEELFVEFKNGYHSYEEFTQMDFSSASL